MLLKKTLILVFISISCHALAQVSVNPPLKWLTINANFFYYKAADLNNDKLDEWIVVTSSSNNPQNAHGILIYSQDANKQFSLSQSIKYDENKGVSALAIGDLNNDGRPDILINQKDSLTFFTQNVSGNFTHSQSLPVDVAVDYLEIGDLNSDGKNDIAISYFLKPYVTIYYQNSNSIFSPKAYPALEGGYNKLMIGDVNADGKNDLIQKIGQLNMGISIYFQGQNAQLLNYAYYNPPANPPFESWWAGGMSLGDLNNDAKTDIIIPLSAGVSNSQLMCLLQLPNSQFQKKYIPLRDARPDNLIISDLDCNGKNEIIVTSNAYHECLIFEQNSEERYLETFRSKMPYSTLYKNVVETYVGKGRRKNIAILGSNDIILLENTSKNPNSTVDTMVVKTQIILKDSFKIVEKTFSKRIDTLLNKVITQNKEQTKSAVFEVIHTKTDTFRIKTSTVCSDIIKDTLYSNSIRKDTTLKRIDFSSIIKFDTLILKDTIKNDTIISDTNSLRDIIIYPNPCTNYFYVKTTNIKKSEPINLSIFSLNGKLVKTEILHGILSELNTQNLADGLYLIRLNFENRVVYKKLVVTYYD